MKKKFHRNASPVERIFTLLHDIDKPFSNQVVFEGTGSFDKPQWEKAVAAACEANPGSRLIYGGWSAWSKWFDSELPAPIRDIDGSNWDGQSPEGASFLSDTLPFRSNHSCEVVFVKGNPLRVVFRTLHATMDGRGSLVWIEDIFRALRGEPLMGSVSTINDDQILSNYDKKTERLGKKANRGTFKCSCLAPTGFKDGNERGNTWKRLSLKGKYSKLLPQIILAIAKHTKNQGPTDVRFKIPVDIRSFFPDMRTTVNLTRWTELQISPDSTVSSIHEQLIKQMDNIYIQPKWYKYLKYVPLSFFGFFFKYLRYSSLKQGKFFNTGLISNLGKMDMDLYQGGGFKATKAFFIPPGIEGNPMFMTLTGYDDSVEVLVSMAKVMASNGRLDWLLDAVTSELELVE